MTLALRPTLRALALGAALSSLASAASAQAPGAPAGVQTPGAPAGVQTPGTPAAAQSPPGAPPAASSPAKPPAALAAEKRPGVGASEPPAPAEGDAPPPRPRAYGGSPSDNDEVNFAVPATRRGGFLLGLVVGGQLTGAEGTPLDYDERGDAFRVSTGTTVGTASALFLGGALTDWFAFKIGFHQGSATKGDYKLASSGLLIGAEAWPLFALGGHWRDLSLVADFGTGAATIDSRSSGKELATAGAYSLVRGGVAWDALRLWKLNFGPTLAFEHTTSETYSQNALWFGLRTVFYGAP
ncbi:MAG TPA: hypothetical protein VFS00_18945 [Polyangiaceae bacterium]|nr:hypothetical protein [Polyangiaceae bacterium]